MANIVRQVTLAWVRLVILALPACGADFSHKLHLGLKLGCVACHATAQTSQTLADNNLPKPESCRPCHPNGAGEIKQPRQANLSRFNHAQHAKLGNVGPVISQAIKNGQYLSDPRNILSQLEGADPCAACHRGLANSQKVDAQAFPQMADCLVCHNKIDVPFSCTTCHAEGANLKPANHTPDYLDIHTKGLAEKQSCAVCHGKSFTCLGCHQGR